MRPEVAATVTQVDQQQALGLPVPPFTAHAISFSLPTWQDTVDYGLGEQRIADVQVSGYPRFFIHLSIQKLARICEQKFAVQDEECLLCPTQELAEQCRAFMIDRSTKVGSPVSVRLVQFTLSSKQDDVSTSCVELHIVLFPKDSMSLARQFWQHTGLCISSRLAERCLSLLGEETGSPGRLMEAPYGQSIIEPSAELLHKNNVEERYGSNLPLESAASAKRAIRRRIAGVLARDTQNDRSVADGREAELGLSTHCVQGVTEDDVYLYPTGMAAIWNGHQLALGALPPAKSVCFGFPYCDSLKCLEKWGPGCHHFGRGLDDDIDELEELLERESQQTSGRPVLLLLTEIPTNPLLRSADLPRLRKLANEYDFLLMVDETIGNFANVEVLPYADIVVSSLSKVFSGYANVLGGSLVLNPQGRHYTELKAYMAANFKDFYFEEDAICMERNSRDFRRRIAVIDENALAVCEFLRARSLAAPSPPANAVVKTVNYPKWVTPHNYDKVRVRGPDGQFAGGYGGLFSVTFTSLEAAKVFFETLPCAKGPSLGTNFTLATPYTILAHSEELDWAAGWGVEVGLVRVSVGLEDRATLIRGFEQALCAAEAVVQKPAEVQ